MSGHKDEAKSGLWFTDGARYGRADVRIEPDGGVEIRHHEMGASQVAVWGGDDHEATLELSPTAVAQLARALLTERYAGRPDALEAIKDFCEERDIPIKFAVWT